jgi:hypothetical protein
MTNATEIVRNLKPEEIRQRLTDIDAERKALMTLLRAVLARESASKRCECRGGAR